MKTTVTTLGCLLALVLCCSSASAAPAPKPTLRDTAAAPTEAPIDINSAGEAALLTLPGFSPEIARKLIAARPYGSKAQLVTRKVLPLDTYDAVKARIVARQPFKDGKRNAASLQKHKKVVPAGN